MPIDLLHHQVQRHGPHLLVGHELVRDVLVPLHPGQDRRQSLGVEGQLELVERVVAGLVPELVVLLEVADDLLEE